MRNITRAANLTVLPSRAARLYFASMLCAGWLYCAPADTSKVMTSSETLRLVNFFLKTETADLPPEAVPAFMNVDPKTLPEKLRNRYLAKKEELMTLKKIADSKKQPTFIKLLNQPKTENCGYEQGSDQVKGVLRMAGYEEIKEDEENFIMQQTDCTECELISEFSLRVLQMPPKKKGEKPYRVYMLHERDPMWTLVGAYRQGRENPFGTNFFGLGHPKCR